MPLEDLALFPALLFLVSLLGYLPAEPALATSLERMRCRRRC